MTRLVGAKWRGRRRGSQVDADWSKVRLLFPGEKPTTNEEAISPAAAVVSVEGEIVVEMALHVHKEYTRSVSG